MMDIKAPSRSRLSYLAMLTPDVALYQHMVPSWEFTSKKNTDFTKAPFSIHNKMKFQANFQEKC